jgi:uncharacterized protein
MGPPMGPPPGPGFGWGSNGFPPPPKKKSKAGWIVLPIAIVGLAVVGFAVLSSMLKHNSDDYTQPGPTSSTYEPTEGPTYFPTTTKVPTTKPTQPKPTQTRTTPPPPSNSDIVTKNRIYKTGKQASVGCRESGARATSTANAQKYYVTVLRCLVRAWPKQVTLAGARFAAPHLIVFHKSASTPCGTDGGISFYCSANATIYMDVDSDLQYSKQNSIFARAVMTDTVAHEFGHHVQNMTGILRASSNLEYQLTGDKSLEMSRRLEIQATCFGAVFMGANKNSYKMTGSLKYWWTWMTAHSGDEYSTRRDHGSRAIQPRWANAGFNTLSPAACNTYVAASKYVR